MSLPKIFGHIILMLTDAFSSAPHYQMHLYVFNVSIVLFNKETGIEFKRQLKNIKKINE